MKQKNIKFECPYDRVMKEIYSSLAGKVLRKAVLLFFKFPFTKVMDQSFFFICLFFLQAYIFGLFELKNCIYLSDYSGEETNRKTEKYFPSAIS